MGGLLASATGTNNNFVAASAPITKQDFAPGLATSADQFNQTFGNQGALATQLNQIAGGQGPNPAQIMLNQATNRNIAQNAGMIASQKGLNPALAARLIAQNSAAAGQQAAGQGALMGAQQQMGALGQLANVYGQQQQGALGMNQNLQNAQASQNNAIVQNQVGMNNANAQVSMGNQQNKAGLVGGLMGGLGAATGLFAEGGMVPQGYADGGTVGPQSLLGKFITGFGANSSGQNPYAQGFQSLGAGINGLMQPSVVEDPVVAPVAGVPTMMPFEEGGAVPGQAPVKGDSQKNDTVPAMLSPGEIVIPRHITQSKNAPELASKFVEMELLKHEHESKKNYADGGQVPSALTLDAPVDPFAIPTAVVPAPQVAPQPIGPKGIGANLTMDDIRPYLGPGWQNPQQPMGETPLAEPAVAQGPDQGPANMPQALSPKSAAAGAVAGGGAGSMDNYLQSKEALGKEATQADIANNYKTSQKLFDLDVERENILNDVRQGKIEPRRFFNNMSTGDKVMTTIGLILGGMGSGLTGKPNAALELLNKHIDNDIKAQEMDMQKNNNLLRANFEQVGNVRAAAEMTKMMQRDLVADKLFEIENNSQDPFVRSRAALVRNQIAMQNAQIGMQMKMYQQMQSGGAGGQGSVEGTLNMLRLMNPEMAKSLESRYVPGVGVASVPVDQKVREKLTAYKESEHAIKDLLDFSEKNTTLIPGTPKYVQGESKARVLQAKVRESLLNTVYREGEQPLLDKFVDSNPAGAFKMLKTQPKLKALLETTLNDSNVLKKSYGLPTAGGVDELKQKYRPSSFKKAN